MTKKLMPLSAQDIMVEWATAEGGIGVIAYTNSKGEPYIGLYTINQVGCPNGLPNWFKRDHLISAMSLGSKDTPRDLWVDIEVSARGISLLICVPSKSGNSYRRHTFAPWGSDRPHYGLMVAPTQMNKVLTAFPHREDA